MSLLRNEGFFHYQRFWKLNLGLELWEGLGLGLDGVRVEVEVKGLHVKSTCPTFIGSDGRCGVVGEGI